MPKNFNPDFAPVVYTTQITDVMPNAGPGMALIARVKVNSRRVQCATYAVAAVASALAESMNLKCFVHVISDLDLVWVQVQDERNEAERKQAVALLQTAARNLGIRSKAEAEDLAEKAAARRPTSRAYRGGAL